MSQRAEDPNSRRNIVVTGANGFIGSRVCSTMRARGHTVVPLVRPGVSMAEPCIFADMSDLHRLSDALTALRPNVIVHCAWSGHPRSAGVDYAGQFSANVVPAINLTIAGGSAGVQHLVLISSGGGMLRAPNAAKRPPAYGWAKRVAELASAATAADFGFDVTVLRPTAVYGPGQDPSKGLGVVATFAERILSDDPLRLLGSPESGRDFLHVTDLAECVAAVVEQGATGTFEVGGPELVTLGELVRLLELASGRSARLILEEASAVEPVLVRLDNGPIGSATGWVPRRRVAESLSEVLAIASAAEGTRNSVSEPR